MHKMALVLLVLMLPLLAVSVYSQATKLSVSISPYPPLPVQPGYVQLTATPSGGTGTYEYAWYYASSNGACPALSSNPSSLGSTPVLLISISQTTAYCVVVMSGSQQASATITVAVESTPQPAAPSSPTAGCGLLPDSIASKVEEETPWYCPINEQIYNSWKGEAALAWLAVLMAFAIAALIYLAGVAGNNQRIKNYGLGEFYEATASAIIVAFFLYICAVLFGLLPAFVVATANPYATAFQLMLMVINSAEKLFDSMYQIVLLFSMFASVSVHVAWPLEGLESTLFMPTITYLLDVLFVEPASVLGSFAMDGIVAIYSEYYILMFFALYAIPVFLVPGVILRVIMPTRALGGAMISVAMGFYLVMPTLFAVAYYFTAPQIITSLQMGTATMGRDLLQGVPSSLAPSSPIVTDLQTVQAGMSNFWLLVLFYPVLIIAITYTFIAEFANFIGGVRIAAGRLRGFI